MISAVISVDCVAHANQDEEPVATARRTKRSLKDRPKHIQARALRTRRRKAKLAAKRRRSRNTIKARRQRRGKLRVR